MWTHAAAVASLRNHYLFAALREPQFARIAKSVRVVEVAAHQLLFQRGNAASCFYVVLEGQIALTLHSRDGQEKVVERVTPGRAFAEAVMFMETVVYPVDAAALEDTVVAAISNAEFSSLLRENNESCLQLLADLSRQLHARVNEIEVLTLKNATDRLASHLLVLAGRPNGSATILLEEPKQMLASRLGIKPETLSRSLRYLTDAGVLTVEGRAIHVLDVERLQRTP